jgi:hypothetical protein
MFEIILGWQKLEVWLIQSLDINIPFKYLITDIFGW